jgi:hypothetical protein
MRSHLTPALALPPDPKSNLQVTHPAGNGRKVTQPLSVRHSPEALIILIMSVCSRMKATSAPRANI